MAYTLIFILISYFPSVEGALDLLGAHVVAGVRGGSLERTEYILHKGYEKDRAFSSYFRD